MTYWEFVLEVNKQLGGSYVNGMLTPPNIWTQSVTAWSRYVQQQVAVQAVGMVFTALPKSEIDALHYGGYAPGSAEAAQYVALVEAQGWIWSEAQDMWIRKETGLVYIPPPVPYPTPTPMPTPRPGPVAPIMPYEWLAPFCLAGVGLYALNKSINKSKKRRKK